VMKVVLHSHIACARSVRRFTQADFFSCPECVDARSCACKGVWNAPSLYRWERNCLSGTGEATPLSLPATASPSMMQE